MLEGQWAVRISKVGKKGRYGHVAVAVVRKTSRMPTANFWNMNVVTDIIVCGVPKCQIANMSC